MISNEIIASDAKESEQGFSVILNKLLSGEETHCTVTDKTGNFRMHLDIAKGVIHPSVEPTISIPLDGSIVTRKQLFDNITYCQLESNFLEKLSVLCNMLLGEKLKSLPDQYELNPKNNFNVYVVMKENDHFDDIIIDGLINVSVS